MARGKAGPKPVTKDEIAEEQQESTVTEPTNIISPDPPDEPVGPPLTPQVCACDDCAFEGTYEEWTEHSSGTGHTGYEMVPYEPEPEQAALFETEGVIR